jgi:dephospho-CoA kinase
MLEELGAVVVDADLLARQVLAPGTEGLREVAQRFPEVVDTDGVLDRAALGARIFADPAERTALNAIVHPRIARAFQEARAQHQARGVPFLFYDAALLLENGLQSQLDGVLLVAVPPEVQQARLMAREGLDVAQVAARLQAQWPLDRKLPLARWVVDNSGSLEKTREQVRKILATLQALKEPC